MTDSDRLEAIERRLAELVQKLEASRVAEYVALMERPRTLILNSFYGGVARGVGIAIGVSMVTAVVLRVLHALGALNLPVIGDWIADIVRIVERNLESDVRLYGS